MSEYVPDPEVKQSLVQVYEEVMWLAARPDTIPSSARAWCTHIASNRLRRHVRRFTGLVSARDALDDEFVALVVDC